MRHRGGGGKCQVEEMGGQGGEGRPGTLEAELQQEVLCD